MADLLLAEREPYLCKEMHRGWPNIHWPAMAGDRVYGQQEVGTSTR